MNITAILIGQEEPSYVAVYVDGYLEIPFQDLHCSSMWMEVMKKIQKAPHITEQYLTEEALDLYNEGKDLPDYLRDISELHFQNK